MDQLSIELLPQGIRPTSSLAELHRELFRVGILLFSTSRVKDVHYQDYVLPVRLKSMDDVTAFLRHLDAVSVKAGVAPGVGCAKANSARWWMRSFHRPDIPDLRWAIRGLASGRHEPCPCHEADSFHPAKA